MYLEPVTTKELLQQIKRLNPKKTSGPDSLKPKLIRDSAEHIAKPLTYIINLSFKTGIFPDMLKIAQIVPIYKAKEKYLPGNYRPISLLNCFGKITEKLVHKRLYTYLNKYKILYIHQYGFRTNHSTILALIELIDNIKDQMNSNKYAAGLYVDLKKAFDTVDHSILLAKLDNYGIRGVVLKWFRSYLSDRSQYTLTNNTQSDTLYIRCGVPQGSVLGPLLFLIYINDIRAATDVGTIMLFADDANMYLANKNLPELFQELKKGIGDLSKWFHNNKLSLSLEKTQYTIFHSKRKHIPDIYNSIQLNNTSIHKVQKVKYLGMTIDENLSWEEHVRNLKSSLTKLASSFKIIKHYIPRNCKMNMYYAYAYSKIQYGIEVYGGGGRGTIKQIQILQNRVLKILFNKDWLTPTKELHKELKVLLVSDIHRLQISKFVYKFFHNTLPPPFADYYKLNSNTHEHHTRTNNHIHIDRMHSPNTVKVAGAKIYNDIPECIRTSNTLKTFAHNLKQHSIDQY